METERTVVRFEGIEIDLDAHRLRRDGVEQSLEPKAFAVLAHLVRAQGRVIGREALLDAVWGHRHVTPGTLNRIVTLLRHALGETAENPRYLHTVFGVGYRFEPPAAPESNAAGSEDDGNDLPASAAARNRSRRYRGILLGATALALVALAVWWGDTRTSAPPSRADSVGTATPGTQAPVLAVLPLRALGTTADGAEFADGLTEDLVHRIARIDGLTVTSHTSSRQLLGIATDIPTLARRVRASHVLEGSVQQDGERLRVVVRLLDAQADRALWSGRYDRAFGDILVMQDEIAGAVAGALQLELALQQAPTPRVEDAPLYRRYLLARRRATELPGGFADFASAREEVAALVRDAPNYAPGWGLLAILLWVGSSDTAATERERRLDEAKAAATRALALDPAQPGALAVRAALACRDARWSECLALQRGLLARFPSDSMLRHGHARTLATLGYVDQALTQIDEAIARDPLAHALPYTRVTLLIVAGRSAEAEAALRNGALDRSRALHILNAIWSGDCTEALARARSVPDEPRAHYRSSQILAAEACADPARRPLLRAAIEAAERGAPDGVHRFAFARLLLPERDYERDMENLLAIQRLGYADVHLVMWHPAERGLRRSAAFRRHVHESGLLAYWQSHGWPDRCRADAAGNLACD